MTDEEKLIELKAKAKAEGWDQFIKTRSDERAVLDGCHFSVEAAESVCFFIENFIHLSKSRNPGQLFTLLPYQRYEIIYPLFGWLKPDGMRRFNRGYIEVAKKNAKALDLKTEIPTPQGFKQLSDIGTGDYVFAIDGNPTRVVAESEIFIDHDCYELEFANGESIVADAGHLWELFSHNWKGKKKILSSQEIFNYLQSTKHPLLKVRKGQATQTAKIELPIDPYILGYWLGDGSSAAAHISCGVQDIDHLKAEIKKAGFSMATHKRKENFLISLTGREKENHCKRGHSLEIFGSLRYDKLRNKNYTSCLKCERQLSKKKRGGEVPSYNNFYVVEKLRNLGVLNNKHIPELYLFADRDSRLALLQGLLDSDGTVSKASQVSFTNCNDKLARDFYTLARSLGFKATISESEAKINGRYICQAYVISFFTEQKVFRLERKNKRLNRKLHKDRQNWIYLKSIKKVDPRPVKCIQVEHEEKLFLTTRSYIPTHNSTIAGAIGNYMLFGDGESSAEIYCAANDKGQAKIVWDIAADMVETSPYLSREKQSIQYSTSRIVKDMTSWFAAWSSDRSSKDGPIAHCVICDELHEWKGEQGADFFNKIKFAGRARRQPLCPLVITTAGSNRHGICFDQHMYARKVLDGTIVDKQFFALIYAADEKKIKEDPDYWKSHEARAAANPGLGTILTEDDFLSDIAECENNPTALNAFLRYRLNLWVQAENPWMDLNVWRNNIGEVDEEKLIGCECFTGIDLASTDDTTAIVHCFPIREKPQGKILSMKIVPRIFVPEESAYDAIRKNVVSYDHWIKSKQIFTTPGSCIDYKFIYAQLEKDIKKFNVKEIAYDRALSVNIIPDLMNDYPNLELVPFGQGWVSMSEPIKAMYVWLQNGMIEHGGHPVLEYMAGNAVAEYDPRENITLTKRKSTGKIDGIIAMIMGFARALLTDVHGKQATGSIYASPDFDKFWEEFNT